MQSLDVLNQDSILLLKKHNLLSNLVKCEIKNDVLSKIQLEPDTIEEVKISFWKKENISNEGEFDSWLKSKNIIKEEFLSELTKTLKIKKYCRDNFLHQADQRFLQRKSSLDIVIYSIIRVKDVYLANELYLRIKEGENDFGEIAKEFSEGPEKNTKGIVGPVSLSQGHPAINNIIKSSSINEVRDPFKLGEWFIILRVESLREAVLDTEMENLMTKELFEIWLQEQSTIIIKDLEKDLNSLRTTDFEEV